MLIIQGTCNRCGQCCGAPGSPNRDSPWPDNWPEALARWDPATLGEGLPLFSLVRLPGQGGPRYFATRVGRTTYRGIWIPGHGLCRDNPPWGDEDTYEETCPFLGDQQPDGSYPCGLVDSAWEDIYNDFCAPMGQRWTEAQVTQWQADHPLCSYTWVAEE
jgi:hypothetical protein